MERQPLRGMVAALASNRIIVFIYRANVPFIPLYLFMVTVFWPAVWGSWQAWRPDLWRAAGGLTNPSINTHHTLVLWILGALYLALRYKVRLNPMLCVAACFIVLSWHEIEWWVVDWALGRMANPTWLLGGYLYPLATITTIFYFLVVGVPRKYIALMAAFYVGWLAIGFPVSVNWTGRTSLYDDPLTNWLEIASWAWAAGIFYVFERRALALWQLSARSELPLTFGQEGLSNQPRPVSLTMKIVPETWGKTHKRRAITAIVEIAVGLIVFSTLGFTALTMLQTSSTAGWSTAVATVAVTVTAILAAIAVALSFYSYAKGHF